MADTLPDDLWRDFPKTAQAFEARFKTEEDCRACLMKARWGGKPACAKCQSTRVWPIRGGVRYECAVCRHQTSLTSGTVFEKTRKPLKLWFRAIFEISSRRTGISAMDLMRIMGFGSYETAWTWLHKLRSAMVRSDSEPLGPFVEMDEALVGGKGGPRRPNSTAACASPTPITMTLGRASSSRTPKFRKTPPSPPTATPPMAQRASANVRTTLSCRPKRRSAQGTACRPATSRRRY